MGIFDKLLGKDKEKNSTTVCDDCTIVLGDADGKAVQAFRAKGIKNILSCWSGFDIKGLAWPDGKVNGLVACVNHSIPIGVINYLKWYGQVLKEAELNFGGMNPEIKITHTANEKVGMILLHWDSVDKQACVAVMEKLEHALIEWSK